MDAMRSCTPPTTKKKMRSFLGLVGWYRRLIPNFSEIRKGLLPFLISPERRHQTEWSGQCESALLSPDFDRPFIVQTDDSGVGLGAVLLQEVDGCRRPVAYIS